MGKTTYFDSPKNLYPEDPYLTACNAHIVIESMTEQTDRYWNVSRSVADRQTDGPMHKQAQVFAAFVELLNTRVAATRHEPETERIVR
jgi:hypothetical protein